jgi:hypothetical protein
MKKLMMFLLLCFSTKARSFTQDDLTFFSKLKSSLPMATNPYTILTDLTITTETKEVILYTRFIRLPPDVDPPTYRRVSYQRMIEDTCNDKRLIRLINQGWRITFQYFEAPPRHLSIAKNTCEAI